MWRIFKENTEDNDDEEAKHRGQRYEDPGQYAGSIGVVRWDPAEGNLIFFINHVQDTSEELAAASFPRVGAGVAVNMLDENVYVGQEECQEVTYNDKQSL